MYRSNGSVLVITLHHKCLSNAKQRKRLCSYVISQTPEQREESLSEQRGRSQSYVTTLTPEQREVPDIYQSFVIKETLKMPNIIYDLT